MLSLTLSLCIFAPSFLHFLFLLLYFFALGAWGCVYSYTPEVYPTDVRGSGTGWAAAFGRIGAFIAPFIVPVVYSMFGEQVGFTAVFVVLTAAFAIVAIVMAVIGQETKGRSLAETTDEEKRDFAAAYAEHIAKDAELKRIVDTTELGSNGAFIRLIALAGATLRAERTPPAAAAAGSSQVNTDRAVFEATVPKHLR